MSTEIREDTVWQLDLGYVNAYLVDDDGELTLIDAGTPRGYDRLCAELDATGHTDDEIDRILITHFDPDHVGTLAHLDTDAPIYAMDPDAGYIDRTEKPSVFNRKGFLHRIGNLMLAAPGTPIKRVKDRETVGGFRVYHTPGHTDGHIAFYHPDHAALFVGDLVGDDDGLTLPPWFMTKDPQQDIHSIKELQSHELAFDLICMGHGTPIKDNAIARFDSFAEQL